MTWKKTIFLVTSLLYILYMLFPLFGDMLGLPIWLPSLATFSVMLLLYPKVLFKNKAFIWFLIYAFALTVCLFAGHKLTIGLGTIPDKKKIIVEFALILPSFSILSILVHLKDESLNKLLIRWSIIILFLSFIVSVPLMMSYNSIREALLTEMNEELSIPGLPGYSLMHAYTLFLPVLCYSAKAFSGKKRVLSVVGLLILCFVIYDTFVTTSLVVMISLLVFTVFYSDNHMTASWLLLGLLVIFAYLLYKSGIFIPVIDAVMPAFEGTAVESKLSDFKESMIVGHITGGSITGRQDYHAISIDSFFQNPLFGTSIVGGHSSLMDRLGGMGLFVGLPFIMMIVSFIKSVAPPYETRMGRVFFWAGVVTGLVYLYNKGNWGGEDWLIYVILMPFGLKVMERAVTEKKGGGDEG